jgi:hypothetical protein
VSKPYIYKRADDLGIPVVDATAHQVVTVTSNDIVKAKAANSKHCALARSALRVPGVVAAYFFRSAAFLEFPDRMVRYILPMSVQKEIVSFDRAGIMASGIYRLSPIPVSQNRAALDARSKTDKKKRRRAKKERAAAEVSDAIAKLAAQEIAQDTPEQREFEARIGALESAHVGGRTVAGIKGRRAPEPIARIAPTRYVHRTAYIRDQREPMK